MKLVIVTGMSGAGKTVALKMMEDMGYYCVDNLPISLIEKFAELALEVIRDCLTRWPLESISAVDRNCRFWIRSWNGGERMESHLKSCFWMPAMRCY